MKRFLKKIVLLAFPFLTIGICYLLTDPYKRLWNYDYYLFDYMMLSRGDVSTRVYLKNKDKYHYNSFIFGSSRSCAHTSKEWKKYLSSEDMPYSYGSFNEPLLGIYRKIRLIDSLNQPIKNVFIVIDLDRTLVPSVLHFLYYDHYLISQRSMYDYYVSDFTTYLNSPKLIFKSVDYFLFHKQRNYMKGFIGMKKEDWDPVTNDWYPNTDDTIKDTAAYYENRENIFYARPNIQHYQKKQIDASQKDLLLKMNAIFKKHHTNCKLVIAPLYNQLKMDSTDLRELQAVFSKECVYDYSGINHITNNIYNYLNDSTHYKPIVGKMIFKEIYDAGQNQK